MNILSRSALILCVCLGAGAPASAQSGTAQLRHSPTINGTIDGSVRLAAAESVTLNSSASVTGDLLLPGTPTVQQNGKANYAGTLDGDGAALPSGHKVILNSGASLRHVIRRSDPEPFPSIASPPKPAGTRSVSLNRSGQSPGDFATLKSLTLNSNVGSVAIPAGTYGSFTANSGSGFVLGVAGSSTPAIYNFQNLTLNSGSSFRLVGPVVVTIDGGFSTNADMGEAVHPEWLQLQIAGGGLTLASNKAVYAVLTAPSGTLTLNGRSLFYGAVTSDRVTVNSGAVLRVIVPAPLTRPPTVTLSSPATGTRVSTPATIRLEAAADAPGSSVEKVEFFQGDTKLGECASAPYVFDWVNPAPGTYSLSAKVTNASGDFAASVAQGITVATGIPFAADFEAPEGYALGSLAGQGEWISTGSVAVVDADAAHGAQSALLLQGQPPAQVLHAFPAGEGQSLFWVDLRVLPVAGEGSASGTRIETDSARAAFVREGDVGVWQTFDSTGWNSTRPRVVVDADGQTRDWTRLTLRLDYVVRRWDLYVDGAMASADVPFLDPPSPRFSSFSLTGHATVPSLLDDFAVTGENPLFVDADRDGMPDDWEAAHGLNPVADDRATDLDADGISNVQEYVLGTDPNRDDTDGDGLPDGWEQSHQFDPRLANQPGADTDGDGLSDVQEYASGTNPRQPDTDGDTIPDGWEKTHGLDPLSSNDGDDLDHDGLPDVEEFRAGTDPSLYDTDGDGIPDGVEVAMETDPLHAQPEVALDSDEDSDGLSLRQELMLGTDPRTPDVLGNRDTDGDGLRDKWEVTYGTNLDVADDLTTVASDEDGDGLALLEEARAGTDPRKTDTDGDGMRDGEEVRHALNPLSADAQLDPDGDGTTNYAELQRGTDPHDYYNGIEHEILPLIGGDFDLGAGGVMAVRVVDKAGRPMINAPVILELQEGTSQIALTPDGPVVGRIAEIRTGPGGIARAYIKAP